MRDILNTLKSRACILSTFSSFFAADWHFCDLAHFQVHVFNFLKRNAFDALLLLLESSSPVVITQIARLTESHRVVKSFRMFASPGELGSTRFAVARGAHVLGVVLARGVWALGDLHHVYSFAIGSCFSCLLRVFILCFFLCVFFRHNLVDDCFLNRGGGVRRQSFHRGGGLFFNLCFSGFFQNFIFQEILKKLAVDFAPKILRILVNQCPKILNNSRYQILGFIAFSRGVHLYVRLTSTMVRHNVLFVHISRLSDDVVPNFIRILVGVT